MTRRLPSGLIGLAALAALALTAEAQVVTGPVARPPGTMPAPMQPAPQPATPAYTGNVVTCVIANPPPGTVVAPMSFAALSWSFSTPTQPLGRPGSASPYVGLMSVRTPLDSKNNALFADAFSRQTAFSTVTITIYKAGVVTGQVVLHNALVSAYQPEMSQQGPADELVTFAYQSAG